MDQLERRIADRRRPDPQSVWAQTLPQLLVAVAVPAVLSTAGMFISTHMGQVRIDTTLQLLVKQVDELRNEAKDWRLDVEKRLRTLENAP